VKHSIVAIAGLALAFNAAAAGLDALEAYKGSWRSDILHFVTPYGKAGREMYTLKNDCWHSGDFYACNQFVDGESKALLVFTYDAKQDAFASYPIVAGSDQIHAGKLIIKGNEWTFPWETNAEGKTVRFRVVNTFTSATTIDFKQEYSEDGEHWTVMAAGHEIKQH
jgi:hypothetical protein